MLKIQSFEFNAFGVNTYVVWDDATLEAAVIDPGMASASDNALMESFIDEQNLTVVHLVNTHLHIDHTLGDDFVTNRYGTPLEANDKDEFLGVARDGQARMFGMRIGSLSPLKIGIHLKEGDKIMIGSEALDVLEVPGHSPGSLVLYAPSAGFVITGDVLFRRSIGRTDLPGGNHRQLLEGIFTKLLRLPDNTVVYPGHGPSTTIGQERRMNPMLIQ